MDLFEAGYSDLTSFDYSSEAVARAGELYAGRPIKLLCADARDLPFEVASFDAVLDKGSLDAIGICGWSALEAATAELVRVVSPGGIVVSISRALEPGELVGAFDPLLWEPIRDGGLHVAEGGEVSTDLAASLFAWRRRPA